MVLTLTNNFSFKHMKFITACRKKMQQIYIPPLLPHFLTFTPRSSDAWASTTRGLRTRTFQLLERMPVRKFCIMFSSVTHLVRDVALPHYIPHKNDEVMISRETPYLKYASSDRVVTELC